jgi:hypothetical protein
MRDEALVRNPCLKTMGKLILKTSSFSAKTLGIGGPCDDEALKQNNMRLIAALKTLKLLKVKK